MPNPQQPPLALAAIISCSAVASQVVCQICGATVYAAAETPVMALNAAMQDVTAHLDQAHHGWRDGTYSMWGDT